MNLAHLMVLALLLLAGFQFARLVPMVGRLIARGWRRVCTRACPNCSVARQSSELLLGPSLAHGVQAMIVATGLRATPAAFREIPFVTPRGVGRIAVGVIDGEVFDRVVRPAIESAHGEVKKL